MIVNQSNIACQSLMRRDEFCFRDRDKNKNKNRDKNKIVSKIEHVDDERFREALIRDAEIRDVDDISEQIEIEMI
jgi:hypothetical protein